MSIAVVHKNIQKQKFPERVKELDRQMIFNSIHQLRIADQSTLEKSILAQETIIKDFNEIYNYFGDSHMDFFRKIMLDVVDFFIIDYNAISKIMTECFDTRTFELRDCLLKAHYSWRCLSLYDEKKQLIQRYNKSGKDFKDASHSYSEENDFYNDEPLLFHCLYEAIKEHQMECENFMHSAALITRNETNKEKGRQDIFSLRSQLFIKFSDTRKILYEAESLFKMFEHEKKARDIDLTLENLRVYDYTSSKRSHWFLISAPHITTTAILIHNLCLLDPKSWPKGVQAYQHLFSIACIFAFSGLIMYWESGDLEYTFEKEKFNLYVRSALMEYNLSFGVIIMLQYIICPISLIIIGLYSREMMYVYDDLTRQYGRDNIPLGKRIRILFRAAHSLCEKVLLFYRLSISHNAMDQALTVIEVSQNNGKFNFKLERLFNKLNLRQVIELNTAIVKKYAYEIVGRVLRSSGWTQSIAERFPKPFIIEFKNVSDMLIDIYEINQTTSQFYKIFLVTIKTVKMVHALQKNSAIKRVRSNMFKATISSPDTGRFCQIEVTADAGVRYTRSPFPQIDPNAVSEEELKYFISLL